MYKRQARECGVGHLAATDVADYLAKRGLPFREAHAVAVSYTHLDVYKRQDFHAETAARVFGVPVSEVTPDLRSRAKAVNFGIVYGQQAYGLSPVSYTHLERTRRGRRGSTDGLAAMRAARNPSPRVPCSGIECRDRT